MILVAALLALVCALVPCVLFVVNLRIYRVPAATTSEVPAVSVLIPARNEAAGI